MKFLTEEVQVIKPLSKDEILLLQDILGGLASCLVLRYCRPVEEKAIVYINDDGLLVISGSFWYRWDMETSTSLCESPITALFSGTLRGFLLSLKSDLNNRGFENVQSVEFPLNIRVSEPISGIYKQDTLKAEKSHIVVV